MIFNISAKHDYVIHINHAVIELDLDQGVDP